MGAEQKLLGLIKQWLTFSLIWKAACFPPRPAARQGCPTTPNSARRRFQSAQCSRVKPFPAGLFSVQLQRKLILNDRQETVIVSRSAYGLLAL